MFVPTLVLVTSLIAFALLPAPARALDVIESSPAPYELQVDRNLDEIWIRFDGTPVVPGGTVRVAGVSTGLRGGTATVSGDTLRFELEPGAFLPGEMVTVGLRNDISVSGGGGSLTGGHYFAFTVASAPASASWSESMSYGAARIPYFIHSGDFDGDGTADLAVPNEGTNDVSIFLNTNGVGVFTSRDDNPVGNKPSSIFGEDFDNDGDQDLATADIISGTVSVLLNDGDGSFAPAVVYPAAGLNTECRQVHGADFDGDGDIDLAATSRGTDEVYIYRGHGDGTFAAGVPYTDLGAGPFALHTGDFDLDGHVDIGVACQTVDRLYILTNDGTGQFSTSGDYACGNGPWDLVGNDMDGDGDLDLVAVNSFGNQLAVLKNNGSGAFTSRNLYSTGSFPLAAHVADLDGDGDIDATASNFSGGSVDVFENLGGANLTLDVSLPVAVTGSYTWASDLDGDGDLDLSVVDELADSLFVFYNGSVPSDAPKPDPNLPAATTDIRVAPNPMSIGEGTTIYLRGLDAAIEARIYTVSGRHLRTLANAREEGGDQVVRWDGRDDFGRRVPPGRYFLSVEANGQARSHEILAIE